MKFKKPIINGINVLDKEKICELEDITEENLNMLQRANIMRWKIRKTIFKVEKFLYMPFRTFK